MLHSIMLEIQLLKLSQVDRAHAYDPVVTTLCAILFLGELYQRNITAISLSTHLPGFKRADKWALDFNPMTL